MIILSEISRRVFLKNTAIGAAGVASISILGACGAEKDTKENNEATAKTKVTHNPVRTEKCDVVVVGSGTAGMCAAVRAAELGASVIQLEKLSAVGGTSIFAEGVGGLNSYMHKKEGKEFDVHEAVGRSEEYHHWAADAACLKRFISESGKTIDWLHDNCGIEFWQATVTAPTSYPSWHLGAKNGQFAYIGKSVIEPLEKYGKKCGVDLRVSNPATGLIIEKGTVKGVYVQDKSKKQEYAIKAKAVVLATGGYASNKAMFERFTGIKHESVWNYGQQEGRDGDGISWAEEAGASLHFPGAVMFGFPTVIGGKRFQDKVNFLFSLQPTLRVNERGLRFFNEGHHFDFGQTGNTLLAQSKVFSLMDQSYLDHLQNTSVLTGYDLAGYPTGKPWAEAGKALNELIEKGLVYKFDTVEKLAKHIECDAKILQTTLDEYNAACANGKDIEFGKPAEFLLPLKTAPYYVAQLQQTMFTTVGGLRVDEYWRVTDTEGKPISGLYALGNDASSIYGHDYDVGIMSGSQQGWCATGGRLVAEHAMGK